MDAHAYKFNHYLLALIHETLIPYFHLIHCNSIFRAARSAEHSKELLLYDGRRKGNDQGDQPAAKRPKKLRAPD